MRWMGYIIGAIVLSGAATALAAQAISSNAPVDITANEAEALRALGPTKVVSRPELEESLRSFPSPPPDPWQWDAAALSCFCSVRWPRSGCIRSR